MRNKLIVIIAIILFPIVCFAGDDYLSGYIMSRGGYIGTQAEGTDGGNNVTVNIVIENNQPAYPYYYPYTPIFPRNLDTWRYGSPHDIKQRNFGHDHYRRHPRWRR